jgi:thymidylate synthase (FAD)
VNEYSARYSILDREFYVPDVGHIGSQSLINRQGRTEPLLDAEARRVSELLTRDADIVFEHYRWMLNEDDSGGPVDTSRRGISRELARIGLPLSTYTQWYWKVDLHNLFNFLRLRVDQHAQYEIRVYAEQILEIVKQWVPMAYQAFLEYQLNAANLSASALKVVSRLVDGQKVTQGDSGLTPREWRELMAVLGL